MEVGTLNPQSEAHFLYNPFAGVMDEDVQDILIPRIDLDTLVQKIEDPTPKIIELSGRQGRGKTTHLRCLQQRLYQYPLFKLHPQFVFSTILQHPAQVVFVDSIHHLPIRQRIKLFKAKKTVIYTTHMSRKWESKIAGKRCYAYNLNGIEESVLLSILNQRLVQASSVPLEEDARFTLNEVRSLMKRFGDNYRGIINHLYELYQ